MKAHVLVLKIFDKYVVIFYFILFRQMRKWDLIYLPCHRPLDAVLASDL